MLRICGTNFAGKEPGFRATGAFRFDDPSKTFETLYCAASFETCYHETVVRERRVDPVSGRIFIPRSVHDARSLTMLLVDWSALRMVEMFEPGSRLLGYNGSELVGSDYRLTQSLARSLYAHSDEPHGGVYRSRYNMNSVAVVLFDRAKPHVRLHPAAKPTPLTDLDEMFLALTRSPVPLALI